jgi:amino acid efflux transporter
MPQDLGHPVSMTQTYSPPLSSTRGTALYVGALLGPSLLLLPGLAARLAGPASILAWVGMLAVSGTLAWVFARLGARFPGGTGVAGYVTAGLGAPAGRAVGWCFLVGVMLGAPVVCLIGGAYVAALLGGGRTATVVAAAALLAAVVTLTLGGARASTAVQLVLVVLLVLLVVVAVTGSAPSARAAHWTPFLPHGWTAIGSASSVLMLAFVGWEAIAPLTARLRDPRHQLPRVIGAAFVLTAVVYLALAAATVGVLGATAGSAVPLADLLHVALGTAGPYVAAVAAVALTLAATNAYLTGAAALAKELGRDRMGTWWLQVAIVAVGVLLFRAVATGRVDTVQVVALPTASFLAVYLGCTVSAVRTLTGPVRVAAAATALAVAAVLAFTGPALLLPVAVAVGAYGYWLVRNLATRASRSPRSKAAGEPAGIGPDQLTATTRKPFEEQPRGLHRWERRTGPVRRRGGRVEPARCRSTLRVVAARHPRECSCAGAERTRASACGRRARSTRRARGRTPGRRGTGTHSQPCR